MADHRIAPDRIGSRATGGGLPQAAPPAQISRVEPTPDVFLRSTRQQELQSPPTDSPKIASPTRRMLTETVAPAALAAGGLGYAAFELANGAYASAAVAALVGGGASVLLNRIATWYNKAPAEPSSASSTSSLAPSLAPSLEPALSEPAASPKFSNPRELIAFHDQSLRKAIQFAVGDARTFSGQIPAARRNEILERAARPTSSNARALAAEQRLGTSAARIVAELKNVSDPGDKARILRGVSENMTAAEKGVCTTFAAHGAHVLSRGGSESEIPIEIISRRNKSGSAHASTHLFNVVGRRPGSVLTDPSTWGPDARVVDLWLGALGNPLVYTPEEYRPWVQGAEVEQVYTNKSKTD